MKQHRLNILKLSTPISPDPEGKIILECIVEIERLHDVLEAIVNLPSDTPEYMRSIARAALNARY